MAGRREIRGHGRSPWRSGDLLDKHASYLPKAPLIRPVYAQGIVTAVDTRAVGNAIIELGGGRRRVGENLDLSVGFSDIAPTGTELDSNTPLAVIHAASEAAADRLNRTCLLRFHWVTKRRQNAL